MTDPATHQDFDPWDSPMDELAVMAREVATYGDPKAQDLSDVASRKEFAAYVIEVLQARTTLEAAEIQRQAVEAQTETSRKLVHVTWWLVGVTALLAIAAVVALFVGAS